MFELSNHDARIPFVRYGRFTVAVSIVPMLLSIVLLDGARTLGAKILVAGGGRCNVTHHEVSPEDFAGGSRRAIGQVLRQFPVLLQPFGER